MSSEPVISVRNTSKTYQAYDHPLYALIARTTGGRFGKAKQFHALRNVSFDIRRGESVGIVGRNGSGKSTLLQLICGIRQPSMGTVSVSGRISALLELGSGFHPDFTGRENVFMQGAIVGLTKVDMEKRFDQIAAFADIGEYLEQPIKSFSTGMVLRLAFAVAISVEPEILIIDEALAVGDTAFQVKCMNRMQELAGSGVAMLLVSHNAYQIQRMCNRAIYLTEGTMRMDGNSFDVLARYESDIAREMWPDQKVGVLTPSFRFLGTSCDAADDMPETNMSSIDEGQEFTITIRYALTDAARHGLQIGILLKSVDGARVFGAMSDLSSARLPIDSGAHATRVRFSPNLLLAGSYTVSLSAFDGDYSEQFAFWDNALQLRIESPQTNPLQRVGSVALPHQWTVDS